MIYCAIYRMHGQSFRIEAESESELQAKIFGKAYAPRPEQVRYFVKED